MKRPCHFGKHDPHLGDIIQERMNHLGISKAELARRIYTSRQNVNSIVTKPCLHVGQLWLIGQALGFDPFYHLSQALREKFPDVPVELDDLDEDIAADAG